MRKMLFGPIPAFFAALILIAGGLASCAPSGASQGGYVGAVYDTPLAAADFTLTDQTGAPFSLSSQKGRVVVMTFLYTHCTDVCPFAALKLKEVFRLLGPDSGAVSLVAVSTDPTRDTVPVIADFSRDLGLYDLWHFVTGDEKSLQSVWKSYHIAVAQSDEEELKQTHQAEEELGLDHSGNKGPARSYAQGLSDQDVATASQAISRFGGGYEVSHSTPFWILDRQGRIRVSHGMEALPADITADVKKVLALKD